MPRIRLHFTLAILLAVFCLTPAHAAKYAQTFEALLTSQRAGGVTLASGKAYFYVPGTTTLKAIYTDRNKVTPASNPYTLSTDGTAQVFGDGLYDVKITNSAGVQKFLWEDVKIQDPTGNINYLLSDYSSLAAAIAAIGSTPGTLQIDENATVSADATIPVTLEVIINKGKTITISSGKTLTVNGPFSAGLYQVFAGAGVVVFGENALIEVYPEWWGAVRDTTDQTAKVQLAVNSVSAAEKTVKVSSGMVFSLADITHTSEKNMIIEYRFDDDTSFTNPVVGKSGQRVIYSDSGINFIPDISDNTFVYAAPYHPSMLLEARTDIDSTWVSPGQLAAPVAGSYLISREGRTKVQFKYQDFDDEATLYTSTAVNSTSWVAPPTVGATVTVTGGKSFTVYAISTSEITVFSLIGSVPVSGDTLIYNGVNASATFGTVVSRTQGGQSGINLTLWKTLYTSTAVGSSSWTIPPVKGDLVTTSDGKIFHVEDISAGTIQLAHRKGTPATTDVLIFRGVNASAQLGTLTTVSSSRVNRLAVNSVTNGVGINMPPQMITTEGGIGGRFLAQNATGGIYGSSTAAIGVVDSVVTPTKGGYFTIDALDHMAAYQYSAGGTATKIGGFATGSCSMAVADASTAGNSVTPTQACQYKKAAGVVTISMGLLNINTTGLTAGNQIFIRNLPFTAKNVTGLDQVCSVSAVQVSSTAANIVGVIPANTTYIALYDSTTSGRGNQNVSTITSTAGDLYITCTYLAD